MKGVSLVVQWLRLHLRIRGTQVRSLVQEESAYHRAAEPKCYNYRAQAPWSSRSAAREATAVGNQRPTAKIAPARHS